MGSLKIKPSGSGDENWWKLEASEERSLGRARKALHDFQVDCFRVIWTGISTS